MKFAGDAIFAEWRIHDKFQSRNDEIHAIQLSVHSAASCGASVVEKCSDFPVFNSSGGGGGNDGQQMAILNVHCGLGFGNMAGLHVGNDSRREFIFMGSPIDQVSTACDVAAHGEVMASPEAYEILTYKGSKRNLTMTRQKKKKMKPSIIVSRDKCFFSSHKKYSIPQKKQFDIPFDKINGDMLEYFQRLVSLYVHPVVFSDLRSRRSSGEAKMLRRGSGEARFASKQHRAEAEIRSVYTIFVKVLVRTELNEKNGCNDATFVLLNNVLNQVVAILSSFKAHLRQFIVDDKGKTLDLKESTSSFGATTQIRIISFLLMIGVILIGTFGLRGSTFPKM